LTANDKPQFLVEVFIHHQDAWVIRVTSHDEIGAPVSVEVSEICRMRWEIVTGFQP
jgi:hypothetical protein